MSALEQQLIERIRQLDEKSKQRVLEFIEQDQSAQPKKQGYTALEELRRLAKLYAHPTKDHEPDAVELIHEARDERLNALLGD